MRYLGIDFGLRRIGLAVSEGELAAPWQILEVKNFNGALAKILTIVKGQKFQEIVIGLPEGSMGKLVRKFVKALERSGINVKTADETLSSQQAQVQMISENIPLKKRRSNDAVAAAIILQNYLDNQRSVIASD